LCRQQETTYLMSKVKRPAVRLVCMPEFGVRHLRKTHPCAAAVAIQSNGKIVVAGQAPAQGGSPQPAVLRLTPNGALDAAFVRVE